MSEKPNRSEPNAGWILSPDCSRQRLIWDAAVFGGRLVTELVRGLQQSPSECHAVTHA